MKRHLFILLLFVAVTFLLYFPILGNGFLTDDYASLYRLLIEKRFFHEELARPLIDISFYLNYLISGLNPVGYYIFNLLIHACACYMVYRVALDLPLFSARRQTGYALLAGFLFVFYPFHNEGVVWLSGRLSSMAALFGLIAIHFSLTKKRPWNFLLAAFCWLAGLFAYESIIVLPAIVILLEWIKFRDGRRVFRSAAAWTAAGLLWLAIRYVAMGGVLTDYGMIGMTGSPVGLRLLKVLGRCVLPPGENAKSMTILFGVVLVGSGLLHYAGWRRSRGNGRRWSYIALELSFLLAILPAVSFGVSTRTSEGDRLLYFPSCILCLIAAGALLSLLPGRKWLLLFCVGYAAAAVIFISANNRHWVAASQAADSMLHLLRGAPGRVLLVNAPDEWEGAFIFRNNFNRGLMVNGIDTNKVLVSHVLTRLEYLKIDGRIQPVRSDSSVFIYPATRIIRDGERFRVTGFPDLFRPARDRVYYWDKYEWKPLILRQDVSFFGLCIEGIQPGL